MTEMKFIILIYNILVVWLQNGVSFSIPNKFHMIADVITSYEQSTEVVAKVCWQTLHKHKLSIMLSKENLINIRYINEIERVNGMVPNNHLLFLVDLNCASAKYFLDQASSKKMFNKTYRWLILGKANATMEQFEDLNILIDSEFVVAEEQGNEDFILQAVYKIHSKSEFIIENYGMWTVKNGLNKSILRKSSKVMRRRNLRRHPLVFSAPLNDNRTRYEYSTFSNLLVDPPVKVTYHSLKNVYDFVNATEVVTFTTNYGYLENGTWDGMFGDIYSGKAEFSGSITFIRSIRLQVVEYTTIPAYTSVPKIVFRKPSLSYEFNLFLLPFSPNVWLCLGAFLVITTAILYVNTKWDLKKYEEYNQKRRDQTCLNDTWSDMAIFVLSAVFQQGSTNELKGSLGRLVMFIILLTFVFLYISYSACIVVLLQSTSNNIKTVTDLTNSKLEFGIEDLNYNRHFFSESFAQDPVRKAFYKAKVASKGKKPKFYSITDGVKKLQKEPFAFSMYPGTGYRVVSDHFQEHEKCGLVEIDYLQSSRPYFSFKKHSPNGELYRVGFIRVEEYGLSARASRIILAKKPTCSFNGINFTSVNMVDFHPALLMLLYGMILAAVLLILEILVHRIKIQKYSLD